MATLAAPNSGLMFNDASGNNHMDMGMILELAVMGMKHGMGANLAF